MSEPSSPAPRRQNRVNWIGLRTLRQLPKVVGETSTGEPIVEVRSVRLVLREGAAHFSRMATCSKCGREVPGAPVLSPGDLDHPPHPVICRDCVRTAAPVLHPDRRSVPGAPEPEAAEAAVPEPGPTDAERDRADSEKALDERMEATRTELRSLAAQELARVREDVDRMMKGVVARLGLTSATDPGRLQALETRIETEVAQLRAALDEQAARAASSADAFTLGEELVDGREELRRDVESRLQQLGHAFDAATAGAAAHAARVEEELGRRIDAWTERGAPQARWLDDLEARVGQLQGTLDAQAARTAANGEKLAVLERQLDERTTSLVDRLDRQAERSRRPAPDTGRLHALEQRLDEAMERLAALVESQRLEFDEGVRDGLTEVRSAVAALEKGTSERVDAVEQAAAQRALEAAELGELQATLDTGLGELRSELERLRETGTKASHIDPRVDALVDVTGLGAGEPGRGRRGGKKSTDAVAALSTAVENLLQDHRQLRAQLATLENEAETAVRASARASAQATAVHPLRQDVRALRDQVAAQQEAVAALAKTVETLARSVASEPATPRRRPLAQPKPTKPATATKSARPSKTTRPSGKA